MDNNSWYAIKNISRIDSPALVVYKERVVQNILAAIAMVQNKAALRPHVKTNKMAEVCALMLREGITKFKCATIAEAEMLARVNAPDVLLAYQPVGPKAERLLELVKQFRQVKFSCITDNIEAATFISTIFLERQQHINVLLDINTGMNRTGISPAKAAALFEACLLLPNVHPVGLHVYDGNIRDADLQARKEKCDRAFAIVNVVAEQIKTVTNNNLLIVAGGTPTFTIHAKREGVECSPGTFVFTDWGYKHLLPEQPFNFAALVITRIISIIDEETICLDLGHKCVAAENPLPGRVHFLNAPDAILMSQNEEHLVVKVADIAEHKIGEVWYGVPLHICPTVALYERAVIIENNEAKEEWKVAARDRRITV